MNGLYKHFKGAEYKVIGIAKHTESGEELVLYALNKTKVWNGGYDLAIWARPRKHFEESVIVGNEKVPRFQKLDEQSSEYSIKF